MSVCCQALPLRRVDSDSQQGVGLRDSVAFDRVESALAGQQQTKRVHDLDSEGVRQTVDVVAGSVCEASVLALSVLSKHNWIENVGRHQAGNADRRAGRDPYADGGSDQDLAGAATRKSGRDDQEAEAEGPAGV